MEQLSEKERNAIRDRMTTNYKTADKQKDPRRRGDALLSLAKAIRDNLHVCPDLLGLCVTCAKQAVAAYKALPDRSEPETLPVFADAEMTLAQIYHANFLPHKSKYYYMGAFADYKALSKRDPRQYLEKVGDCLYGIGQCCLTMREYDLAEGMGKGALQYYLRSGKQGKSYIKAANAHALLAEVTLQTADYKHCLNHLCHAKKILTHNFSAKPLWRELAWVDQLFGELYFACSSIGHDPYDCFRAAAGNLFKIVDENERFAAALQCDLRLSRRLTLSKQYEEAERTLASGIAQSRHALSYPLLVTIAEACAAFGDAVYGQKDYPRALKAYEKAADLLGQVDQWVEEAYLPCYPDVWRNMGKCYQQLGQPLSAEVLYKRAVHRRKSYAIYATASETYRLALDYFALAQLYHTVQNDLPKAAATYRMARAAAQDCAEKHADLLVRIQRALASIGQY